MSEAKIEIIEKPKINKDAKLPIKINENFDYQPLKRITYPTNRVYQAPCGNKLPSVTTILDGTSDQTFLIKWREFHGEKKCEEIKKNATGHGTIMHEHLEKYLLGEERPRGSHPMRQCARNMADLIIKYGLKDVSEVWGIEAPLYYPGIYAGTSDLIGIHENEESIIDFKNSAKIKKEEYVQDYYVQGAAYAMAHNKLFGTNIKKIVILMASRNLEYRSFVCDGFNFDRKKDEWLMRIETYFKSNGTI